MIGRQLRIVEKKISRRLIISDAITLCLIEVHEVNRSPTATMESD